ncbi:MAG: LysR family transcriptional regulator [Rubrivivax sp.]
MDRLQAMQVFARVAQHASFAAAARDLHLSPAAVSKQVGALEAWVGARLLQRTTRQVALTEAGRIYLEHCLTCLHAVEDAEAAVGDLGRAPTGQLRVSAPIDFGDALMPALAVLMAAHPQLVVDLQLSNRVLEMVEEGIDVALRIAQTLDGRYVARPVARTHLAIYGSAGYFARHDRPLLPQDLVNHHNLVFTEPRPMTELRFTRGRRQVSVKLPVTLLSNHGAALVAAARAGLGLAVLPSMLLPRDPAAAAELEPVLLDWALPTFTVHAAYPHRRFVAPKVRAFLEAVSAQFGDPDGDPWWPSALPRPDSPLS